MKTSGRKTKTRFEYLSEFLVDFSLGARIEKTRAEKSGGHPEKFTRFPGQIHIWIWKNPGRIHSRIRDSIPRRPWKNPTSHAERGWWFNGLAYPRVSPWQGRGPPPCPLVPGRGQRVTAGRWSARNGRRWLQRNRRQPKKDSEIAPYTCRWYNVASNAPPSPLKTVS